jgi:hypothetical protein
MDERGDTEQDARERARVRGAQEREQNALERERSAEEEAAQASDATSARLHREEAATHARAAQIHGKARELQEHHLREIRADRGQPLTEGDGRPSGMPGSPSDPREERD